MGVRVSRAPVPPLLDHCRPMRAPPVAGQSPKALALAARRYPRYGGGFFVRTGSSSANVRQSSGWLTSMVSRSR